MKAELAEVLWLDEHHEVTLTELAQLSGLAEDELRELAEYGVIMPLDPHAHTLSFSAIHVREARTAARLRHDFDLDLQGLMVALGLMDRIEDLEAQLRRLSAQLPSHIR